MCGRFAQKDTPQRLAEYFQATSDIEIRPSFNIAPSARIVTVTEDIDESRHLRLMRWGLIPAWAKDSSIGNKLANARGETVADKPSFRSAFRSRRCLIPATGFYEWKTIAGSKQPYFISYRSGEPLAMAGLWESWRAAEGEVVETCCIITTDANELMRPIHDRMPVLLDKGKWQTWLNPKTASRESLQAMLNPHEPESMQAWPVTRELNRVGLRDDAGLIESDS